MIQKWVEIALWKRTLVALILGWLFGYLLPNYVAYVEPLGKVFLNGIKMVVIPLIFSTLISSITGIGSYKELKAIGGTTIFWFLITAIIATALGLTIAFLLDIGKGANFTQENWKGWKVPPLSENWVNLIPKNPIDAAAKSQVLPIVIFGLLLAISAVKAGDKAKSFNDFFVSLSETLFELVRFLMQISPIGVFAIIAGITKKYGWEGISVLFDVLIAIYLAAIIHIGVVYSGLLKFVAKVNPIKYFKKIFPAQILAFSTTSSYGTLPVTLEVTQKAGVSKRVSSFVTPLGATINMDGCGAFYPAISAVFIANLYNIELGLSQYAIIVLTATLSSLGTAGVPWASATALMMVLPSVGLPIEPVALLMSIDRILDMARTTVNVTGDTVVSAIVARKVNEFDDSLYKTN